MFGDLIVTEFLLNMLPFNSLKLKERGREREKRKWAGSARHYM
jgi:hypothetical protein